MPWLQGDQFDAVMNYRLPECLPQFLALRRTSPTAFDTALLDQRQGYPEKSTLPC